MAYQTRQRDPLLDSRIQAALERRGKELLGLMLCALGVALGLMLVAYTPGESNWVVATDAAPRNYPDQIGAVVAAILMWIIGYGSHVLAAGAVIWGLRFLFHRGSERALWRVMFLPVVIAIAAVYAASHPPGATWTHSFGLGGHFGDTVLGALLHILPLDYAFGLKLLAAISFATAVTLGLFVFGVSMAELRGSLRFMAVGLASSMVRLAALFGKSAHAAAQRGNHADPGQGHVRDDTPERPAPRAVRAPASTRSGLLTRVPLLRRVQEPAPTLPKGAPLAHENPDVPSDERIRKRIADAIRNRVRRPPALSQSVTAPELTGAQAPAPHSEQRIAHEAELSCAAVLAPPAAEPRKVVQHNTAKRPAPSRAARADAQPSLPLEATHEQAYAVPPLALLANPATVARHHLSDEALEENARMLENVLDDYGVRGEIVSVRPGPVVTMYELEPAPGLKASRVIGLADDIARSMSALSARVSTVPGRSVIGIELPNQHREKVVLREILSSRNFGDGNDRLPLALGKGIGGDPIVANLAKMPHLLIAGTTGSGKSVAINTMILSLLYKLTPEDCRMIMIDPKMLELSVYDGIPHLLSPVVTDPKKAVAALKWVVGEMEERYRKMSKMGVRNIEGYNGRVKDALNRGELFSRTVQTGFDDDTGAPVFETEEFAPETMPFIVVIVDEMADLMMVAGKEIEACIQRLAQMARASGIHLVMATQRPSVDVITGTIKANFPTRISFHVTSKIDSRTILGEMGAEQLLGMGDMLYMAGGSRITRVHGPFVSDEEVEEIVRHLKSFGPPEYAASVLDGPDAQREGDIDLVLGLGGATEGENALYDQAVQIVIQDRKCSTSYIQRKLAIGYNKAARLVEQMEENGLVSAANHVGKREILVPEQD
ncbi:MAG: DNA translocase FtsK 4TM domain-containing protein [Rhodobacteraceae bacterium]|nr:DNA translocase FtsK 4TM domain-containing protein [Paracoccaceae bacterium]